MSNMSYDMTSRALDGMKNNNTVTIYKRAIKQFCDWAKVERGIKKSADAENYGKQKLVQEYCNTMEESGRSPWTIHTHIAAICKGYEGLTMKDIEKPIRSSGAIVRSRIDEKNQQGKKEAESSKYERLVAFQQEVGIRRAELSRLTGADLVRDESGYLCVRVRKGKGGKEQLQRVLNEDVVRRTFAGKGENERIFSKEEMSNHIDLHGMRADVAREAYEKYCEMIKDPEAKDKLQRELIDRFERCNKKKSKNLVKNFVINLTSDGNYELRGNNRQRALDNGRPTTYNRLALLAVSVFHLSHWRIDGTIANYII